MVDTVEQELPIPDTDTEKIAWLWDRLDEFTQANANLASELDLVEKKVSARDFELDKARSNATQMGKEMAVLGVELNKARAAAESAVRDYIANTSD